MRMEKQNPLIQKAARKALAGFLAINLLAAPLMAGLPGRALGAESIGIYVNGQLLETDTPAYLSGGRTLIPIRVLMENLGAQVEWDGTSRTIKVMKSDGGSITLWAVLMSRCAWLETPWGSAWSGTA